MKEEIKKFLGVLNSKPVIGALIFIMLSLITVWAGNVIVDDGSMTVENNLNSSGVMFVNSTSGNVGIGTTSPSSKLFIKDTSSTPIMTIDAGSQHIGGLVMYTDDGEADLFNSYGGMILNADNGIDIKIGWADRIKIDASGRLGLGTTDPTSTLNVVGNANITSTVILGSLKGTYGSGSAHVCVYNNGTLFTSESACP